MPPVPRRLRTVDIGTYQDAFLISAVTMIIVIRLQLWFTNYPQLGGGGLHIAHLLWGGVFMVLAITVLVVFVGRGWRLPASVVGGIGFGFFIDELGKFITEDNDYFFQPTAALIYVIFIGIYFAMRWLRLRRGFTEHEYLTNAVDILTDASAEHGLTERDKRRALDLLGKSGDDPLVPPLRKLLEGMDTIPDPHPSRPVRVATAARERYERWTAERWFQTAVIAVMVIWSALNILSVLFFTLFSAAKLGDVQPGFLSDEIGELSFTNVASFASAAVASVFSVLGLVRLRRRDRIGAYREFEKALLITIFVTQVFVFAESSFSATTGMLVSIALLLTVRYFIVEEDHGAARGPMSA